MSARIRALLAALFWIAVGVVSYVLGVQSTLGQRAEENVLDAAEFTTAPPPPLNLVSPLSVLVALAVIALIALAAYGWKRALGVVLVAGVTITASQLLKLWMLPRPVLLEYDAPNTFPSGHMTTFAVLVAALIWAVPRGVRPFAAIGGTALLCIVAWQLLAYGWHRPSDVYGAIALGALAFSAAVFLRPLTAGRPNGRGTSLILFMSALALLLVAAAILIAAVVSSDSAMLLISGQIGACGASALACRTMLNLTNPA